jgi:recombination associated protein RdgC
MPFATTAALYDWCGRAARNPEKTADAIEHFIAKDPAATTWSSMGFVGPVDEGRYVHDLDGTARLMVVQFNERKLPASVRDEKISTRYAELTEKGSRKLNKQEYAQLREDVENSLLPQAFIVRSTVPVLVFKDRIMICSTSAKKVESVLHFLNRLAEARNIKFEFIDIKTAVSPGYILAELARNTTLGIDDDGTALHAGKKGKFKGEDKRTISVSERDVSSEEVQKVMATGTYNVVELAMSYVVLDDAVADFTLTDKFVFKGVKLSDVTITGIGNDTDDLHATYWLLAKTFKQILDGVTTVLNEGEDRDGSDEEL